MTLQQLYYFCAVSREMSYRRAAEVLRIAQPSLSSAISRLEEELGFILFERKGRHIELTKYGNFYYKNISELLEQIDTLTEKTRNLAKGDTGNIDIAYNAPFGKKLVPILARKFLDIPENKKCTFHFHQASSPRIVDGLRRGKFDVGICSMEPLIEEIKYIPLLHQELVGIVPKNHELSKSGKIDLKELVKFPYVDYTEENGLHSLVHKFLKRRELSPKIIAKAPDEDSIAALVSEGFGVSFVASINSLKNYDVKILNVNEEECYRTIYLAYDEARYLTPAVQRFIKYSVSAKIRIS